MPSHAQKRRQVAKIERNILVVNDGRLSSEKADYVAIEEPLEIAISYPHEGAEKKEVFSITMRSPGQDEPLALGFLYAEGIIAEAGDVERTESRGPMANTILVHLRSDSNLKDRKWERHVLTNSSCGVCGKSSIDFVGERGVYIHRKGYPGLKAETLFRVVDNVYDHQTTFRHTGGVHAAVLFDMEGNILSLHEDVGRHNAMDKLVGQALMNDRLPLKDCGVLFSGRCSFELIQKAHMAGIPLVASVGAPSSLAIELAEETGITLIGFIKGRKFNIYNDQARISGS